MKRLLKNNRGMSLMEILVALSLLMIIIVGTTPVMLQAYNGLYKAGEFTQGVYNAKTEVEDQLATRSSVLNYSGFTINFQGLGEVATVNAKRAVSSLKNSLETLFTNARVRVYISSGSEVNDDQPSHSITLQTINLEFAKAAELSVNNKNSVSATGKKIDITAYLPDKAAEANTASAVYTENRKATVAIETATTNPTTGRIGINISSSKYPIDFTTSPIKILITYLDENNKVKSVHTYLTIKTPTIIIAGETNDDITYYTTAGVQDAANASKPLVLEARKMNIGYDEKDDRTRSALLGAASTQPVPSAATAERIYETLAVESFNEYVTAKEQYTLRENTVFKSVNWITEFARTTGGTGNENVEYANSCYEPEYYVLTGTNGAIYRTYTFTGTNTITGKTNLEKALNDPGIIGLDMNSLTGKDQTTGNYKNVMGINDTEIYLDDRASTVVYPAVWGGDFTHVYAYSTYDDQYGYLNQDTWQTEDGNTGKGQKGYYSNLANYGYYYNGYGLDTSTWSQNSKKISYILTELPYAMRVGGRLQEVGGGPRAGYDYGHNRIWERPVVWETSAKYHSQAEYWRSKMWEYYQYNDKIKEYFPRCVLVKNDGPGSAFSDGSSINNQMPVYFARSSGDDRPDNGLAQLRIKALTTLSPSFIYDRWRDEGGVDGGDDDTDVRFAFNKDSNHSQIVVTDAVYIPATTTTEAQVFYVGTVAAYAMIYQTDNIAITSGADADTKRVENNAKDNTGGTTSYYVMGSNTGKTFISKINSIGKSTGWKYDLIGLDEHAYTRLIMNQTVDGKFDGTGISVNEKRDTKTGKQSNFFVQRIIWDLYEGVADGPNSLGDTMATSLFNDLAFTMGYTSNREMVYSKIVYGDVDGTVQEAYKSYEPFYFLSHYNDENHVPTLYMVDSVVTGSKPDKLWLDGSENSTATNFGGYNNGNVTDPYFLDQKTNDYYNVWFPGEMYNLTKVATKDNVTVAVGYAVSGSTYTWVNRHDKKHVSTALGNIYNDGVISGMVLGEDTSFNSLLYFKDDENFDSNSLSDGTRDQFTGTQSYRNMLAGGLETWNYGTHARDSVQFTCVDISVVVSGDTTYYYAYYADNKGRVYRSLVATRGKNDSAATMVKYISDKKSSTGLPTNVSYMEEQTRPSGSKFTGYFAKINTIVAHDDLIIVTGQSSTGKINMAVGVIDKANPTAAPTWKMLNWSWGNYIMYDALIRDGYLYMVGENSNPEAISGCVYAVSLDTLRTKADKSELTYGGFGTDVYFAENFVDKNGKDELRFYAIAGKE